MKPSDAEFQELLKQAFSLPLKSVLVYCEECGSIIALERGGPPCGHWDSIPFLRALDKYFNDGGKYHER